MDLFNSRTVVGLFDNQEDLGQALSNLHKQGFGETEDDLVLINEDHLAGENPLMRQDKPFVVSSLLGDDTMAEGDISEVALEERLMDLGIDEKEVNFYARQIKRGHTLVIVETDDDKAQQAHDIMRLFNAKSSIS
jgi:hypothetical protein